MGPGEIYEFLDGYNRKLQSNNSEYNIFPPAPANFILMNLDVSYKGCQNSVIEISFVRIVNLGVGKRSRLRFSFEGNINCLFASIKGVYGYSSVT